MPPTSADAASSKLPFLLHKKASFPTGPTNIIARNKRAVSGAATGQGYASSSAHASYPADDGAPSYHIGGAVGPSASATTFGASAASSSSSISPGKKRLKKNSDCYLSTWSAGPTDEHASSYNEMQAPLFCGVSNLYHARSPQKQKVRGKLRSLDGGQGVRNRGSLQEDFVERLRNLSALLRDQAIAPHERAAFLMKEIHEMMRFQSAANLKNVHAMELLPEIVRQVELLPETGLDAHQKQALISLLQSMALGASAKMPGSSGSLRENGRGRYGSYYPHGDLSYRLEKDELVGGSCEFEFPQFVQPPAAVYPQPPAGLTNRSSGYTDRFPSVDENHSTQEHLFPPALSDYDGAVETAYRNNAAAGPGPRQLELTDGIEEAGAVGAGGAQEQAEDDSHHLHSTASSFTNKMISASMISSDSHAEQQRAGLLQEAERVVSPRLKAKPAITEPYVKGYGDEEKTPIGAFVLPLGGNTELEKSDVDRLEKSVHARELLDTPGAVAAFPENSAMHRMLADLRDATAGIPDHLLPPASSSPSSRSLASREPRSRLGAARKGDERSSAAGAAVRGGGSSESGHAASPSGLGKPQHPQGVGAPTPLLRPRDGRNLEVQVDEDGVLPANSEVVEPHSIGPWAYHHREASDLLPDPMKGALTPAGAAPRVLGRHLIESEDTDLKLHSPKDKFASDLQTMVFREEKSPTQRKYEDAEREIESASRKKERRRLKQEVIRDYKSPGASRNGSLGSRGAGRSSGAGPGTRGSDEGFSPRERHLLQQRALLGSGESQLPLASAGPVSSSGARSPGGVLFPPQRDHDSRQRTMFNEIRAQQHDEESLSIDRKQIDLRLPALTGGGASGSLQLPSEDTAFATPVHGSQAGEQRRGEPGVRGEGAASAGIGVSPMVDLLAGMPKKGQKYEELFDPNNIQHSIGDPSLGDVNPFSTRNRKTQNSFLASQNELLKSSFLGQQSVRETKSTLTNFADEDYCFEVLPEKELASIVKFRRKAMTGVGLHPPTCGCFKCYQKARYDGLHLKKKFFKPRPAEELAYEQELQRLAQLTSPRSWSKATSTTAGGGRVHVSGAAVASSMSASLTAGYSSDAADVLMRTSGRSRSLNRSSRSPFRSRSPVERSIVTTDRQRRFFVPQGPLSDPGDDDSRYRALLESRGSQAGVDTDLEAMAESRRRGSGGSSLDSRDSMWKENYRGEAEDYERNRLSVLAGDESDLGRSLFDGDGRPIVSRDRSRSQIVEHREFLPADGRSTASRERSAGRKRKIKQKFVERQEERFDRERADYNLRREMEKRCRGDPILQKKLGKAKIRANRVANANYGKAVAKKIVNMGPNGMVEMLGKIQGPILFDKHGNAITEYHSARPSPSDPRSQQQLSPLHGLGGSTQNRSLMDGGGSVLSVGAGGSIEDALREQRMEAEEISKFVKEVIPMEGEESSEEEGGAGKPAYRREKRTKPPAPGGFLDELPFAEDLMNADAGGSSWAASLRNVAPREDTAERETKQAQARALEDLLAGRERSKVNEKEFERFITVLRTQLLREMETFQFREHSVRTFLHEWLLENWQDKDLYSLKSFYQGAGREKLAKILRENELLFGSQNLEENSIFPMLQSLTENEPTRDPLEFVFVAERRHRPDYQSETPLPSDGEGGYGLVSKPGADPFPNDDSDEVWSLLVRLQKQRATAAREYRKEQITRRMEKRGPSPVVPYVTAPVYRLPTDDMDNDTVAEIEQGALNAAIAYASQLAAANTRKKKEALAEQPVAKETLRLEEVTQKKKVVDFSVSNEWLSKRAKYEGISGKSVDELFRSVFWADRIAKESNFLKPSKKARALMNVQPLAGGASEQVALEQFGNANAFADGNLVSSPAKAGGGNKEDSKNSSKEKQDASFVNLKSLPSPARNAGKAELANPRKLSSPGSAAGPAVETSSLLRPQRQGRERIAPDLFTRQRRLRTAQYLCDYGVWPLLDPLEEGDGQDRAEAQAELMAARKKAKKEGKAVEPLMKLGKKSNKGKVANEFSCRQWVWFLKKHCGKRSNLRDRAREFGRRFATVHKETFNAGVCSGTKVTIEAANDWFIVAAQRLVAFRGTSMTGVTSWNVSSRGERTASVTMIFRVEGEQEQINQLPRRRLKKRSVPYGDSRDGPRGIVALVREDLVQAPRYSPGTQARLAVKQEQQESAAASPQSKKKVTTKNSPASGKKGKTSQEAADGSRPGTGASRPGTSSTNRSGRSNRSDVMFHGVGVPEFSKYESILMVEDTALMRKMEAAGERGFVPARRNRNWVRAEKAIGRENYECVKFRRDMPLEGRGKNFLLHLLPAQRNDMSDEDDVVEALTLPEDVPDLRWPRADTGLVLQTRASLKRRKRELKFYEPTPGADGGGKPPKPRHPGFGGGVDFAWTQQPAWPHERKYLLFGDDFKPLPPDTPEEQTANESGAESASGTLVSGSHFSGGVDASMQNKTASMNTQLAVVAEEEADEIRVEIFWNRLHRRPARPLRYEYKVAKSGPLKWKRGLEKLWMLRQAEVFGRYRAALVAQAAALGGEGAGGGAGGVEKKNRFGDPGSNSMSENSATEIMARKQLQAAAAKKKAKELEEKVEESLRLKIKDEEVQYTPRGLHLRPSNDEPHDAYSNLAFMTVTVRDGPDRPAGAAIEDDAEEEAEGAPRPGGGDDRQQKIKGEAELALWATQMHEYTVKGMGSPEQMFVHHGISLLPLMGVRYGSEFLQWWVEEKGEEAVVALFGAAAARPVLAAAALTGAEGNGAKALEDAKKGGAAAKSGGGSPGGGKTFLTDMGEGEGDKSPAAKSAAPSGAAPAPSGAVAVVAAGGGGPGPPRVRTPNAAGAISFPDQNWSGLCGLVGRFRFDHQNFFESHANGLAIDPVFKGSGGSSSGSSSSKATSSRNVSASEAAAGKDAGMNKAAAANPNDGDDLSELTENELRVRRFMFRLTPAELPSKPILALRDVADLFSRVNLRLELDDCLNYRREYARKTQARYSGSSERSPSMDKNAKVAAKKTDLRGLSLRKLEEKRGKDLWFDKVRLQGAKRMEAEGSRLDRLRYEISDYYAQHVTRAYSTREEGMFENKAGARAKHKRVLKDESDVYSDSSADTNDGWENAVDRVRFSLPVDDDTDDEVEWRMRGENRSRIFESDDEGPMTFKRRRKKKDSGRGQTTATVQKTGFVVAGENKNKGRPSSSGAANKQDHVEEQFPNAKDANMAELQELQDGQAEEGEDVSGAQQDIRPGTGGSAGDSTQVALVAENTKKNETAAQRQQNAARPPQTAQTVQSSSNETNTLYGSTTDEDGNCTGAEDGGIDSDDEEISDVQWEESNLLSFAFSESAKEIFTRHKSRNVFNRGYLQILKLKRRRTLVYRTFQYCSRQVFQLGCGRLGVEELYLYVLYLTDRLRPFLIDRAEFAHKYDPSIHPLELLCRHHHLWEVAKLALVGLNPVSAGIPDFFVKPDDVTPIRGASRLTLSPLGIVDVLMTLANCVGCDLADLLDQVDHEQIQLELLEKKRIEEEMEAKLRPSSKEGRRGEVGMEDFVLGGGKEGKKGDGASSGILAQSPTSKNVWVESFLDLREEEREILINRLRPESKDGKKRRGSRERSRDKTGIERSVKRKHFG